MFQSLVYHVPNWVLAVLLIPVLGALAAGGLLLCRPLVKRYWGEGHNDVAGFLFATVGVIYAVILAFLIFAVWDSFSTADRNVSQESADLISVYRDAQVFPPHIRVELQRRLRTYTDLVINDEWPTQAEGRASPRARDALNRVFAVYSQAHPTPVWEGAYQASLSELNDMTSLRTERILASRESLPDFFWVMLILGGVVTIIFSFIFYVENVFLQALGTSLLAAVVGAALLLILEVNYPFTGDVHISTEAFRYAQDTFAALSGK